MLCLHQLSPREDAWLLIVCVFIKYDDVEGNGVGLSAGNDQHLEKIACAAIYPIPEKRKNCTARSVGSAENNSQCPTINTLQIIVIYPTITLFPINTRMRSGLMLPGVRTRRGWRGRTR